MREGSGDEGRAEGGGPAGWIALSVDAPPRGEEIYVAEALRRVGGRGIVRVGRSVVAYLPPTTDTGRLVADARAAVRAGTSLREPEVSWRRLAPEEEGALWGGGKAEARRVSPRLVVAPPGAETGAEEGTIVLRIAPGPAFGSAEHPTTRSCLRLLDGLVRPGDRVLDVGAGSGILSIAAARLGASRVLALEAEEVACGAARENVILNAVEDAVRLRHLRADGAALSSLGSFDGIAANLETGIVLPMLPAFAGVLAPGGWLLVSGIPRGESEAILAATGPVSLARADAVVEGGWWTGVFRLEGR